MYEISWETNCKCQNLPVVKNYIEGDYEASLTEPVDDCFDKCFLKAALEVGRSNL